MLMLVLMYVCLGMEVGRCVCVSSHFFVAIC